MSRTITVRTSTRRRYSLGRILLDVALTFLTGGLWLIWLFIVFVRNGHR